MTYDFHDRPKITETNSVNYKNITQKLVVMKTLLDVKSLDLAPGSRHENIPARTKSTIEHRAEGVPTEYQKRARELDRKMGTPVGDFGSY